MLFCGKKHSSPSFDYNPSSMYPAIRSSICTGEQTAGFINRETGSFTAVMLIASPADRKEFCRIFGIKDCEIKIIY